MLPKTKKRDNSTESPRLVSLLNGCQVVRMVELLGLLGFLDYIREEGDWEVSGQTTVNRKVWGGQIYEHTVEIYFWVSNLSKLKFFRICFWVQKIWFFTLPRKT